MPAATTYPCPNGHLSSDPDYCSECGKKLDATPSGLSSSAGSASGHAPSSGASDASGEACPDCGTVRATPTAAFCEVCRYNFVTRQSWTPSAPLASPAPVSAAPPPAINASPAPAPSAPPVAVSPDAARRWEAVVIVDGALYADPDPANPLPVNTPERVFPLDFAENLIGRRSERRAIYPEVDLSGDSGVSSRHAILYRETDGALALLDVGSTNGTQINGADVTPGVRMALAPGDQITVGCWTRITLRTSEAKP